MKSWRLLAFSRTGAREENDDFIAIKRIKKKRKKYFVMVVCDGVGSVPGSGACAEVIGKSCLRQAVHFVRSRKSSAPLGRADSASICRRLAGFKGRLEGDPSQLSTLALAVADEESVICAWAGDSRISIVRHDGRLIQLSTDHHDEEERLTSYFDGSGIAHGQLESNFYRQSKGQVFAVCLTSDGVHSRCAREEFRHFLFYQIVSGVNSDDNLSNGAAEFLGSNVNDNLSMVLLYARVSNGKLTRAAGDLFGK